MRRAELFVVVGRRLERIRGAQDPTPAREQEALEEARRLAALLADEDGDVEARFLLAWLHWYRFLALPVGQGQADLDRAVQAFTWCFVAGVEDLPEPLLPVLARNGIEVAEVWLQQTIAGSEASLASATVQLWRRILAVSPTTDPDRGGYLAGLSLALLTRFQVTSEPTALDEAVTVGREAVAANPAGHPSRVGCLGNLGLALRIRFQHTGVLADLSEAVTVIGQALAAPAGPRDRAVLLDNLSVAMRLRAQHTGTQSDLDEAITLGWQALAAIPTGDPESAERLSNLSLAFKARFLSGGELADLDQAVTLGRQAAVFQVTGHPDWPAWLSNLAVALQLRFQRTGAQADLDEAISNLEEVVAAGPVGHPDRAGQLFNLGTGLQRRFELTANQADLDTAIGTYREVLAVASADHPAKAMYLSTLSGALLLRVERTGAQPDLDEAVDFAQDALAAVPIDHPDRFYYLTNLSIALFARGERSGTSSDLDEAIRTSREAVAATPSAHPARAGILVNLGRALRSRSELTGWQADQEAAEAAFAEAVEVAVAPVGVRIDAARAAADLVAHRDARRAAALLEVGVRLVPQMASRRLGRGDQQRVLGEFAGLASDAAALALLVGDTGCGAEQAVVRALRLLELGRGVMLSQALDTRSDLTDLRARHPRLAARFLELRDQLDQPADTSTPADGAGLTAGWAERRVADRPQLDAAFEATVAEIRSQDGFQAFLLPPEPDQLLGHAQHGPIVVVNVSRYRSDALLLTPKGIAAVALPDLTQDVLIDQINSFHRALRTAHAPEANSHQWEGSQDALNAVLEWLWDAVTRPILDELGYQRTPMPGTAWPRLWWVPGGLLGLLPLHAAGYHRQPPGAGGCRRTVLDRVISSYTPTIRALGYAREQATHPTTGQWALIVAMPTTPGIDCPTPPRKPSWSAPGYPARPC